MPIKMVESHRLMNTVESRLFYPMYKWIWPTANNFLYTFWAKLFVFFILNCFHFLFVSREIRALKKRRKYPKNIRTLWRKSAFEFYFDYERISWKMFERRKMERSIETHKFYVLIISSVVWLSSKKSMSIIKAGG